MTKKYAGYRLEEVMDLISITKQQSPDSKFNELNSAAKLKGRQNDIIEQAKAKKKAAGNPPSKASFKKDKQLKRAAEISAIRDAETSELSQLRLVQSTEEPVQTKSQSSFVGNPPSTRSAAFLKLVINESLEAGE